jgi:hypothetical protein
MEGGKVGHDDCTLPASVSLKVKVEDRQHAMENLQHDVAQFMDTELGRGVSQ